MSTEPKITLMNKDNTQPLRKWRATQTKEFGLAVAATSLVAGTVYKIVTVGDSDFTTVGAADNNIGTIFTATGAGTGTGTAIQMVKRYNVKSGEDSDTLQFMIWNNRKSNETIDLEVKTGCTTAGDVIVKLDAVDFTVTLAINADTDLVATAIKDALDAQPTFSAAWTATVIPAVKFDGTTVANTILVFTALDFLAKGAFQFTTGTSGIDAVMTEVLKGNDGTAAVSKITDAKIYIRDDQGGITSDVVKDKWTYIKNDADATFTNIGVDTNPDNGDTTEIALALKAVNSGVALGEILGEVNTADLANDNNYDKLSLYMKPPVTGVVQGLRQWKLVVTYNFT